MTDARLSLADLVRLRLPDRTAGLERRDVSGDRRGELPVGTRQIDLRRVRSSNPSILLRTSSAALRALGVPVAASPGFGATEALDCSAEIRVQPEEGGRTR